MAATAPSRRGGQSRRRSGRVVYYQSARAVVCIATLPGNDEHHRGFPLRCSYPNPSGRSMAEWRDDATMDRLGFPGRGEEFLSNSGISRSLDAPSEAQDEVTGEKNKGGLTDEPEPPSSFNGVRGRLPQERCFSLNSGCWAESCRVPISWLDRRLFCSGYPSAWNPPSHCQNLRRYGANGSGCPLCQHG